MLHLRSKIEKMIQELTNSERIVLNGYDTELINNANKTRKHLEEIYDFSVDRAINRMVVALPIR